MNELDTKNVHGILFLCVANSARSQMAEGLARALYPDMHVESAGSDPSGRVHPMAVEAMREAGHDISHHTSTDVDDVADESAIDLVITLCSDEVCPVGLHGKRRLHWPIPDPAGPGADDMPREQALSGFRSARDAIKKKLETLPEIL